MGSLKAIGCWPWPPTTPARAMSARLNGAISAGGKPLDFFSLVLPRETEAYVPKLLAIARLLRNPEAYELALHPLPNAPQFVVVDTGGQLDLARAADLAGVAVETLYRLNPALNRWSTHPDGPHRLLLPIGKAEAFRAGLATLDAAERNGLGATHYPRGGIAFRDCGALRQ